MRWLTLFMVYREFFILSPTTVLEFNETDCKSFRMDKRRYFFTKYIITLSLWNLLSQNVVEPLTWIPLEEDYEWSWSTGLSVASSYTVH